MTTRSLDIDRYDTTGGSRRTSGRRALRGLAAALLVVALGVSAEAAETTAEYSLHAGMTMQLLDDGTLRLFGATGAEPLLTIDWQMATLRRREIGSTFAAHFVEGSDGGLRGFAREADDDGDGAIDEDPADGRDNDGDGAIDEDFAAISDLMGVVDLRQAGQGLHLESYHWAYAHLRSTVMVSGHREAPGDEPAATALRFVAGGDWRRTGLLHGNRGHTEAPDEHALVLVTVVPDPDAPGGKVWLGVSPLEEDGLRGDRDLRARLSGSTLEIPPLVGRLDVAISVAPTWLQLKANLAAAHAVRRGARGTNARDEVPWIVPPLCQACRRTVAPTIASTSATNGSLVLGIEIRAGDNSYIDPDRFRIDGVSLGAPAMIRWEPDSGTGMAMVWAALTPDRLEMAKNAEYDPLLGRDELREHSASGRLIYTFAASARLAEAIDAGAEVSGGWLNGQDFRAALPAEVLPAVTAESAEEAETAEVAKAIASTRPPSLAPELLENFPNPLREQTRFRVTIPRTVGEGFVWEEGQEPLVAKSSPIPWATSRPHSSLKIYNVSGREILTVFSTSVDPGAGYDFEWDGHDAFGRPVASGTYFCKLQIDKWYVTKQVVVLR